MRKYHSPKEYLDAAKSIETPAAELLILAQSDYDFVRLAVAQNPNTTPAILDSLVPVQFNTGRAQELAVALTENKHTSEAALDLIAEKLVPYLNHGRRNELAFKAGVTLCCRANVSVESIFKVLDPKQVATAFRRAVARQTKQAEILYHLLNDPSEAVRKRARKNLENQA